MREEKLERYLKVEGIEPSTEGYSKLAIKNQQSSPLQGVEPSTEGYSKLAIKNQQSSPLQGVEPGTSCTEICHSSL